MQEGEQNVISVSERSIGHQTLLLNNHRYDSISSELSSDEEKSFLEEEKCDDVQDEKKKKKKFLKIGHSVDLQKNVHVEFESGEHTAVLDSFWVGVHKSVFIKRKNYYPSVSKYDETGTGLKKNKDGRKWLKKRRQLESKVNTSVLVVFNPTGRFRIFWDFLLFISLIYILLLIPYEISFMATYENYNVYSNSAQGSVKRVEYIFYTVDVCIDCIFFLDILITFNTGFVDPETNVYITDRNIIAVNYLKGWFFVDFISSVPWDSILILILGKSYFRILHIFRLLKVLKIFRIRTLTDSVTNLKILFGAAVTSFVFLIFELFFTAHVLACGWHWISEFGVDGSILPAPARTWVSTFGFSNSSITDLYVASLYYSVVTLVTVGFGDIHPTNSYERFYAIIMMGIGVLVFASIISNVAQLIDSHDPKESAFIQSMEELNSYLTERNYPTDLKNQAKEAYAYYLTKKPSFGDDGIFKNLPRILLTELISEVYIDDISQLRLFDSCDMSFISDIYMYSRPFTVQRGKVLYKIGDLVNDIILIRKGNISITNFRGKDEVLNGICTSGDYFGDFQFIHKTLCIAQYTSHSNCELLAIDYKYLRDSIENNTSTGESICDRFADRLLRYNRVVKQEPIKNNIFAGDYAEKYIRENIWINGDIICSSNLGDYVDTKSFSQTLKVKSFNVVMKVGEEYNIKELEANELKSTYVFHPLGSMKIMWDLLISIIIIITIFYVPVIVAFYRTYNSDAENFMISADAFFLFDILASFNTAYPVSNISTDSIFVIDRKKIAEHYLKTWFFIDFLSTVPPLLLLVIEIDRHDNNKPLSVVGHIVYLVQLLRLSKLPALSKRLRLDMYTDAIIYNFSISNITFRMLILFAIVYFIGHLIACCWWGLSDIMTTYTWFDDINMVYDDDLRNSIVGNQYLYSIYWSFTTITTVGYGDITPVNTSERMLCICIVVIGATLFGYAIAKIAQFRNASSNSNSNVMNRIREYLKEKNCNDVISEKIINHYVFFFNQTSNHNEAIILSKLPSHISNDLLFIKNKDIIETIPIFKYIENRTVILHICSVLIPEIFNTDQYVVKQCNETTGIYFLISGEAELYRSNNVKKKEKPKTIPKKIPSLHVPSSRKALSLGNNTQRNRNNINEIGDMKYVGSIYPGNFIGHASLMQNNYYCSMTLKTSGNCIFYILQQEDLRKILIEKPKVGFILQNALSKAIYQQENELGKFQMRERRSVQLKQMKKMFKNKKNENIDKRNKVYRFPLQSNKWKLSTKENTSTIKYINKKLLKNTFIARKNMYYSSDEEEAQVFQNKFKVPKIDNLKTEIRKSMNFRSLKPLDKKKSTTNNIGKSVSDIKKLNKYEKTLIKQRRSFSRLDTSNSTNEEFGRVRRQSFPSIDNNLWYENNIRQGIL